MYGINFFTVDHLCGQCDHVATAVYLSTPLTLEQIRSAETRSAAADTINGSTAHTHLACRQTTQVGHDFVGAICRLAGW